MLSEEEKKAVEELKKCVDFWKNQYVIADDEENMKMAETEIAINQTLLNLIETQNKMIELMAECFINFEVKWYCKYILPADWKCASKENCIKCIIEYFRNKAKESE